MPSATAYSKRLAWTPLCAGLRRWTRPSGSLSVYPYRCALARESVLLPAQVRQLLIPPRRPRWRLLFTVHEGSADAPTVRVHLLRRTAQAPLTNWPEEDV